MPPPWLGLLSAKIDLTDLLEQMSWEEEARSKVEPFLLQYELAFTSMLVRLDREYQDNVVAIEGLWHNSRFDEMGQKRNRGQPGVIERSRGTLSRIASIKAAQFAQQRRLSALNFEYLSALEQALAVPHRDALHQVFMAEAYPRVFPDPNDPEPLYEAILATPNLEQSSRDLLQTQWQTFRLQYEGLCDQLKAETEQWHEMLAKEANAGASWSTHERYMTATLNVRDIASETFVKHIAETIPPDLQSQMLPLIDAWRASLARSREIARTTKDRSVNIQ